MKHRRTLILVSIALLAVVLTATVVSACGGTSEKVYTDPTFGYSMTYPGEWSVHSGTSEVTAGGSVSENVGIYNPKGAKVGSTFVDLALVTVYNLNSTVSDPWSSSVQAELEGLLNSLESQTIDVKVEEALKHTTTAGLKGYVVTYTFNKGATPMRSMLYFLFDGNREYELNQQASVDTWAKTKPVLDDIVNSFKPGKVK